MEKNRVYLLFKSQTHRRRADNTQIKNAVIGSFYCRDTHWWGKGLGL